jgi:hypothetical protein
VVVYWCEKKRDGFVGCFRWYNCALIAFAYKLDCWNCVKSAGIMLNSSQRCVSNRQRRSLFDASENNVVKRKQCCISMGNVYKNNNKKNKNKNNYTITKTPTNTTTTQTTEAILSFEQVQINRNNNETINSNNNDGELN